MVDAATIVHDPWPICWMPGRGRTEGVSGGNDLTHLHTMFVTPKDVDETVKYLSFTISEGLNLAFCDRSEVYLRKVCHRILLRGDHVTRFQKALGILLSLCFFTILTIVPEPVFTGKNVYRHLHCIVFWKRNPGK